MSKMTSPRAKGKKVAVPVGSKIKKETDGIKGDYEKPNDVESTLKMMLRQAHEIHKGFYKRNQGLRKSQSFEDLKNRNQGDMPKISGGKGDVCSLKEGIPHKKKLKDPVKLGKTIKAPLSLKSTGKKIRKNSSKDTKVEIRKPTSALSVGITSGKKIPNDLHPNEKKVEDGNKNDVKILYEKEIKNEEENPEKKKSENRVLTPEELLININKIWEQGDKKLENISKTDAKFIEGLLEIGQKVLKKDQEKGEGQEKPTAPLKNPQGSPKDLKEIWRKNEDKEEEEEEEIFEMAIGEPSKELKSYRELKSFVNDELLRIWKPHEKIEIKDEKELKKPEVEELKPGRIIVKPNPTSYLEKRALYAKTNCTSLISKFDKGKKIPAEDDKIKNSKIVKRLENAFETLNAVNWDNPIKKSRVKEEDLAKSILKRIDDHKKVIVGEINRTEQKINEKFNLNKKKPKPKADGDKSLEIHFKRSLEDVQSADGLLLETEKECQEITQKIFEDYRNKKFRNDIQENFYPKETRYKDPIDRKIQNDFKKFGLINFKKTNRIKLRDKGPEKVAECSGWRKKKSQPSRSISRSIGSAGGTDGLPPISLQDEPIVPGKLLTDAKPLDTDSGFDPNKVIGLVDKAEDTDDISCDQVLDIEGGWDETLEDPGGSTTTEEKAKPIFVDLEELRYRKGDPSFRYYRPSEEDVLENKKMTPEEIEAFRRKRELQRILAMDKDYVIDDDKEERSSRKSKDSTGKAAGHRISIIVNHITSGERIDDNEKVLGHASKLVVKEDKEVREKKKMMTQSYYKGMRRVTEPAIPQSQFSDIDVLKRTTRKSEPINIKRTESKDVECQTDTTDTSDDDMDLYSLDDESVN